MTSPDDRLRLLLAEKRRRAPVKPFDSFEELVTSPKFFGLTTPSPLQLAFCRIVDGRPLGELANHPDVIEAVGDTSLLPSTKPLEVILLSAIRVGKSLFSAAACVWWSQCVDVSRLGPGEFPRVGILSIDKGLAIVVFNHLVGRIDASPELKKLVVKAADSESIWLKHPSGVPVEICISAGKKAGSSLVARWFAGVVFDEFPRWEGAGEAVINWNDCRNAVIARILPGGQMFSVGSPWAPAGPAYDAFTAHWKKPTKDLVVIKAPGWAFNPSYWTPEEVEKKRKDPDVFQTDVAANFASPEEALYTIAEIESAIRPAPVGLPPSPSLSYRAAMDPATRGNGWSLVIATREGRKKKVAFAKEWVGSRTVPLNPKDTLKEIAAICRTYGCSEVDTDQWSIDSLRELGLMEGIYLRQINWTETEKTRKYLALKTKLQLSEIELPPETNIRNDLLQVRKRATTNGLRIILPNSSDGRHCDFAPALLMALSQYLDDDTGDEGSPLTKEQRWDLDAAKMKGERSEQVKVRLANESRNPMLARRQLRRR